MVQIFYPQTVEIKGKLEVIVETLIYRPLTFGEIKTKGFLLAIIKVNTQKEEAVETLKEAKEILKNTFYKSDASPLVALETGVNEAASIVQNSLREEPEIISGVVLNNVLYLVKKGNTQAWMLRGEEPEPIRFEKTASVPLQKEDRLFLSMNLEDKEKIKDLISKISFDEAVFTSDLNLEGIVIKFRVEEIEDLLTQSRTSLTTNIRNTLVSEIFPRLIKTPILLVKILGQALLIIFKLINKIFRRFISKRKPEFAVGARRRNFTPLVFLLILLFISSLGWTLYNRFQDKKAQKFQELVSEAQTKIQEAKSVASLNFLDAKNLASQAKDALREAKKLKPKEKSLNDSLLEVGEVLALLNKVYKIAQLPLFYNLSDLNSNFKEGSITLLKGALFVLDQSSGSIYKLIPQEKKVEALIKDQASLTKEAKIGVNERFLFIYQKDLILRLDFSKKELKEVAKEDSELGEVADIDTYLSNFYLLDKGGSIWKYPPSGDNYSKGSFLAIKEDFTNATSLSVDGSIWVVNRGKLENYAGGVKQDINLQGFDEEPGSLTDVYSKEDTSFVYLLSKEKSTIFVMEKAGVYHSQYIAPALQEASQILVDEAKGILFVISDSNIYSLELKE